MRFILWLEWQGFYANEALDQPEVVVRERLVLDANSLAQRAGIRVGMSVSEARNIVPSLVRRAWREEQYVEQQKRWLDLCLPFSGVIEPLDGHIAAVDLSAHPYPRELAEELTGMLVREMGIPLLYGAGLSKWMAKLASRYHDLRRAIEAPAEFLASLSIEDLTAIEPETRERLAFLGYRKIGDVLKLSLATLRGQFGKEGYRILQAAKGALAEPVQAIYPPDLVASALTFDGAPETVEALENGFALMAKELGERLAERNVIAKRLELVLLHEEGKPTRLQRTFTRSIATDRDVFCSLRLMLPEPPKRPIERVTIRLPELRKARRVQLDVYESRSRVEIEESVETAMMHVRTSFGETALRQGAEIPLPRWMRVRKAYREANGWAWI